MEIAHKDLLSSTEVSYRGYKKKLEVKLFVFLKIHQEIEIELSNINRNHRQYQY